MESPGQLSLYGALFFLCIPRETEVLTQNETAGSAVGTLNTRVRGSSCLKSGSAKATSCPHVPPYTILRYAPTPSSFRFSTHLVHAARIFYLTHALLKLTLISSDTGDRCLQDWTASRSGRSLSCGTFRWRSTQRRHWHVCCKARTCR